VASHSGNLSRTSPWGCSDAADARGRNRPRTHGRHGPPVPRRGGALGSLRAGDAARRVPDRRGQLSPEIARRRLSSCAGPLRLAGVTNARVCIVPLSFVGSPRGTGSVSRTHQRMNSSTSSISGGSRVRNPASSRNCPAACSSSGRLCAPAAHRIQRIRLRSSTGFGARARSANTGCAGLLGLGPVSPSRERPAGDWSPFIRAIASGLWGGNPSRSNSPPRVR
jgi:hypothetical protein